MTLLHVYTGVIVIMPDAVSLGSAISGIVHGREPGYANVAAERPIRVSELTGYFQRLITTPKGFKDEFLVCSRDADRVWCVVCVVCTISAL